MPDNKKKQQWQDSAPPDDWQDSGAPPAPQQTQPPPTMSAGRPPSLLERAENWWTSRPEYGGTLGSPGRSPQEKAHDIGTGMAVGSLPMLGLGLATAPAATLLGLGGSAAGQYVGEKAGRYVGEKVGAPELGADIGGTAGVVGGGTVGGAAGEGARSLAGRAVTNPTTLQPRPISRLLLGNERARALGEIIDPGIEQARADRRELIGSARTADRAQQQRERTLLKPSRGGPLGNGRTSVLGGSESAARPSGNLVLTPSEAQSENQLMSIATKRASERGMQFAGGMVPREGRSVPQNPTRYSDPEFSGVRERVPLTPLPGAEPSAPKPLLGQQFSSANKAALAQRSSAMDVPEWVQGERGGEIQRLQGILRNPRATAEERAIAQSQLDNYKAN